MRKAEDTDNQLGRGNMALISEEKEKTFQQSAQIALGSN